MSQRYLTPQSWQHWENMMYQSISHLIALVFLCPIHLLRTKAMTLLNLRHFLHAGCPKQAHFYRRTPNGCIRTLWTQERKSDKKGKFHVPNPLAHLSMPVLDSSGEVSLVAEERKSDISQSAKAIVDGTVREEDITLDTPMGFTTPTLVEAHTRDFSMGDQIFPGILPSEELRKKNIIEIVQGKKLF